MVGTRSSSEGSERAQLVLIGAISIAFILLGVVVVFNSVQYTETVNSGGAESDLSEVRMVESELKTGIETLKNNSGPTFGEGTVEVYINESYQHKETHQQPIYIWYEDGSWDDSEEEFNVTVQTTDITVTRTIEVDP